MEMYAHMDVSNFARVAMQLSRHCHFLEAEHLNMWNIFKNSSRKVNFLSINAWFMTSRHWFRQCDDSFTSTTLSKQVWWNLYFYSLIWYCVLLLWWMTLRTSMLHRVSDLLKWAIFLMHKDSGLSTLWLYALLFCRDSKKYKLHHN